MMDPHGALKVFVLSNPAALERRRGMAQRLADFSELDWSFFDILPAEQLKLKYSDAASYLAYGSVMSPAEISCAASHIGMMETFLADSHFDYLLVLEDDVFLDPNFNISATLSLMKLAQLDYLKLFSRYLTPAKFIASFGRYVIYRSSWPPFGIQSYILSRRGATKMLDHFNSVGELKYPVDVSMDSYWATGLPVVMLYPYPALELAIGTTIHGARNRAQIDNANAALLSRFGPRPTKLALFEQRTRRVIANRGLRRFDDTLAHQITSNRDELLMRFSSNALPAILSSPSESSRQAVPPV